MKQGMQRLESFGLFFFFVLGYKNQMGYRKSDGSFAVWPDRGGSTW